MIDNRENNIWTVYIHIVPKSISGYDYDKYYVGITSKTVEERWKNNGCGYRTQLFYNAIKKHKWNNIEHYIVAEHLTEHEAKEFEKVLIDKLDCNGKYGYNLTDGGDGVVGHIISEKTRKIHSINTTKRNLEKYKTKIYKFSDIGVFIEQFDHMYLACESVKGLAGGGIIKALNNKQTYSYGYIWRYEKDIKINSDGNIIPINLKIRKNEMFVPIYCFDLNGKFIKKYKSAKLEDGKIIASKALKDYKTTYKNKFYRKAYDVISINGVPHMKNEKESLEYLKKEKENKYVYVFDKNTKNFIKKYENIKDFIINENIKTTTWKNYVAGSKSSHNNKYFRYSKDIGFNENNEPYFIK